MLNSPLRWVGGKSRLRRPILALLPAHHCYVEPFGGAAWVLFGKPPSPVEVLNDLDPELINFFRVLRDEPDALVRAFAWTLVARAEFTRLAALDPTTLAPVERAYRFYYLIMAGWGGELRYPRFQTSIQDGGHGNRLIGALATLEARLWPIHARLRAVCIENRDWRACVDHYDQPDTVLYLDPPYPDNGCNYAYNMRDWADHAALAARLQQARGRWIVSSYDRPEIRALFRGSWFTAVQAASGMAARKGGGSRVINREVLITNYDPPAEPLGSAGAAHTPP